jgi:hypothetical protein
VQAPQLHTFSRQLFLISVGSAAVPVFVAAAIMLQSGHGLVSKAAPSLSAQSASTHSPVAPVARVNASHTREAAPQPASGLPSASPAGPSAEEASQISSGRFPGMSDVADSLQNVQVKSDLFQQGDLLHLAMIPIPETSTIHDTVEPRGAESLTATSSASQAKKIRAESKGRPFARHHYRSQKHQPPSLLAKIGESVKKGLVNIAKLPKQAMEGRFGE